MKCHETCRKLGWCDKVFRYRKICMSTCSRSIRPPFYHIRECKSPPNFKLILTHFKANFKLTLTVLCWDTHNTDVFSTRNNTKTALEYQKDVIPYKVKQKKSLWRFFRKVGHTHRLNTPASLALISKFFIKRQHWLCVYEILGVNKWIKETISIFLKII